MIVNGEGGPSGANGSNHTQYLHPVQVSQIRKELQQIRDQVNHLLDTIEPRASGLPLETNTQGTTTSTSTSTGPSSGPTQNISQTENRGKAYKN